MGRTMALVLLVVGMGVGIAGCGDDFDCTAACDKIYDECGLVVTAGGEPISKTECVNGCKSEATPENRDMALRCLEDSSCSSDAVSACLSYYN